MSDSLSDLSLKSIQEVSDSSNLKELELVRVKYLGKNGLITKELKLLGKLTPSERPLVGKRINLIKEEVQKLIDTRKIELTDINIQEEISTSSIDISLNGRKNSRGNIHPISSILYEIESIFLNSGFRVEDGPEIEDEYHNFTALNITENHPARAMHDTFYFNSNYLLRTHTSPIQIRSMESHGVPIKVIAPGKVYRRDSDITHTPMFHQIEGLVIDKNINFTHLKSMLHRFINTFYNKDMKLRFRPSYFPFTEPSAEVDILSKDGSWLEILGCGMVHPKVLENLKIDPEVYTGYAFGMGVERLAMLRHEIKDIRLFYENDLNFLNQFK
ncbi:MAG: phenylalanine--tRNA ligase subunit alpha [Gammaproteobacteria bacterium]|jgi:phenylalanyl-tRNA synthetase alpha chain|nr:phenylalanine--tRNA ligase subunit alpha [Gammaproteobacteria bacterium]MBT5542211.1 phenylalanine--tRNA ligase subunit alpha [Gammaproteobacteria bacterium]MBT6074312.1 phenylalanine--tRNA ligase subunit alpha [Gammaproteobacteria bacterium]MBT7752849.1 phenylalanine--tRNA ligase subunit alpha [Gammaproteobacteria bacterium]